MEAPKMMDPTADKAIEVDGARIATALEAVTPADIAMLAGLVPPDAYAFVRVDGGAARLVGEGETVSTTDGVPRFRSGRVGEVWTLSVDADRWDWPEPSITDDEVRGIAGLAPDREMFIQGRPYPFDGGTAIDLAGGPPRLSTVPRPPTLRPEAPRSAAPRPAGVPVIVNGRPRELADPDATFEDLVKLAFPQLPATASRTFTVSYRRGGAARPEGTLAPRQATRLAPGAVVNVSATDKS